MILWCRHSYRSCSFFIISHTQDWVAWIGQAVICWYCPVFFHRLSWRYVCLLFPTLQNAWIKSTALPWIGVPNGRRFAKTKYNGMTWLPWLFDEEEAYIYRAFGNRSFRQRVSSPTSNVSSPTRLNYRIQGHSLPLQHINYSSFFYPLPSQTSR